MHAAPIETVSVAPLGDSTRGSVERVLPVLDRERKRHSERGVTPVNRPKGCCSQSVTGRNVIERSSGAIGDR
jgi:hypothetical protein